MPGHAPGEGSAGLATETGATTAPVPRTLVLRPATLVMVLVLHAGIMRLLAIERFAHLGLDVLVVGHDSSFGLTTNLQLLYWRIGHRETSSVTLDGR